MGIVSYRSLVRLLAEGGARHDEALAVNKNHVHRSVVRCAGNTDYGGYRFDAGTQGIGVTGVERRELVGLVTEQSFMNVAKDLLEDRLRGL